MRLKSSIVSLLVALGLLGATFAPVLAAPSGGADSLDASFTSASTWRPESVECEFLGLINNYRKSNGLGSLTLSLTLGAAAEHHSIDMAKNNIFSHTLSDGTSWAKNMADHGYPSNTSRAENIAAGRSTASQVFTRWKSSSGHNANMLSSKYNAIGIGRYYLSGSRYSYYWTNTFGSRVDTSYICSGQSTGGGEPRGTELRITGGGRTSSSTPSTRIYDGSTSTSWYTTATSPPRAAYVYVDLGAVKSIHEIKWFFAKSGSADSYMIQISTDKQTWTTIANRTNGRAGSWSNLKLAKSTRYVRFYFNNPNRDKVLGYLGEIKVFA